MPSHKQVANAQSICDWALTHLRHVHNRNVFRNISAFADYAALYFTVGGQEVWLEIPWSLLTDDLRSAQRNAMGRVIADAIAPILKGDQP